MNKEDIIPGYICQSKDGVHKIKIICVENNRVTYEPIIFGNKDFRYIPIDKLLENFKAIDER